MAVHHGGHLSHDLAVANGDDQMVSRRREILGEIPEDDRMIEHLHGDTSKQRLVSRPDMTNIDAHFRPFPSALRQAPGRLRPETCGRADTMSVSS